MNKNRFILMLLATLLGGCSSLGARAPAGVDLTGIWDLNPQYSDKPSALRARERHEERHPHRRFGERREGSGEMRAPGGIGQGPGGGFPVGRPGGMGGYGGFGMQHHLISELGAHEMDIEQRRASLRIEYDRRDSVIYHWGEQQSRRDVGEPPSGWVKGNFVIKAEGRGGRRIERTFLLAADHKSLTVVTKLGGHSMTQRYDLNQAATAKVYGNRH